MSLMKLNQQMVEHNLNDKTEFQVWLHVLFAGFLHFNGTANVRFLMEF